MAPSSTRMRSAASRRSSRSTSLMLVLALVICSRALLTQQQSRSLATYLLGRLRPQAQQMADRVDEVGPVHRVEVELGHPAIDQIEHLLGRDRGSDQLSGGGILVEAVEPLSEPARHRGAATGRERLRL